MPELLILLRVDAAAVALAATIGAAAYIQSHQPEAAAGLAGGLEWAAVRRAQVRDAALDVVMWLLEHLLRAHGQHRRQVGA
jgi:hypothetical protein